MKSKIQPPPYSPTEQEVRIAYLNYILERVSYDGLLWIKMGIDEDVPKEEVRKRVEVFIEKYFKLWNDSPHENKDVWEQFVDYDWFKERYVNIYLSEPHDGDCVGHPATCLRCVSEEMFGQDTVTWENKQEGSKLYHQFSRELKKDKK